MIDDDGFDTIDLDDDDCDTVLFRHELDKNDEYVLTVYVRIERGYLDTFIGNALIGGSIANAIAEASAQHPDRWEQVERINVQLQLVDDA
jgi:hypothetical protein